MCRVQSESTVSLELGELCLCMGKQMTEPLPPPAKPICPATLFKVEPCCTPTTDAGLYRTKHRMRKIMTLMKLIVMDVLLQLKVTPKNKKNHLITVELF